MNLYAHRSTDGVGEGVVGELDTDDVVEVVNEGWLENDGFGEAERMTRNVGVELEILAEVAGVKDPVSDGTTRDELVVEPIEIKPSLEIDAEGDTDAYEDEPGGANELREDWVAITIVKLGDEEDVELAVEDVDPTIDWVELGVKEDDTEALITSIGVLVPLGLEE